MKYLTTFLILLVCASCVNDQGKRLPKNFEYGEVENNVYSNDYFGIKIPIPEGWHRVEQEQLDDLVEIGIEQVSGDKEEVKKMIDASEVSSAQLLTVFEHEVGANVYFNPSIQILAENLSLFSNVKSGADYLEQSKKFFEIAKMDIIYLKDISSLTYGNNTLDGMITTMNVQEYEVQQQYLSFIRNNFAVSIILSYTDDEQKSTLIQLVEQLNF